MKISAELKSKKQNTWDMWTTCRMVVYLECVRLAQRTLSTFGSWCCCGSWRNQALDYWLGNFGSCVNIDSSPSQKLLFVNAVAKICQFNKRFALAYTPGQCFSVGCWKATVTAAVSHLISGKCSLLLLEMTIFECEQKLEKLHCCLLHNFFVSAGKN